MSANPRYWAFLSYSHADESQARLLHGLLERYVLPARTRKAHGLPRRLFPVFRDVEELEAASGLTTRLRDALDDSRWLIVLCSPNSAKSRYVNEEVEYFLGKHGHSRILCVLVEGEPPACFPPAIRALPEEPLAADCRAGRDVTTARLKLIAALAGVGFTELRDREAQRRKRTRLTAAAAALLIGLGALGYWDLQVREHVDYYVGYVRQNGVWHGVDRVSGDTARHRMLSFRFTRHGRMSPPRRVDFVDGRGACASGDLMDPDTNLTNILGDYPPYRPLRPTQRYCFAEFSYDSGGAIQKETLFNMLGVAGDTLIYTQPDLAQISQQGFAAAGAGGGARYVQFRRDARGYDERLEFLYERGVPRENRRHAFGYSLSHDSDGRLTARSGLDAEGRTGGESVALDYSAQGFLLAERSLDAQGQPSLSSEGWTTRRYENDAYGNYTRISYFAADASVNTNVYDGASAAPKGEPQFSTRDFARKGAFGYASVTVTRDGWGNLLKKCAFDETGQPVAALRDEVTCVEVRYDDHGRLAEWQNLGASGELTDGSRNGARFEYEYDEAGNVIEVRCFDRHRRPRDLYWAGPVVQIVRNARGYPLEYRSLDASRKPVMARHGAVQVLKYDDRDRVIEQVSLDTQGQPTPDSDTGSARITTRYDERGNRLEERHFGADLKPVLARDGYATVQMAYDDQGNMIEMRFLDVAQRLMRNRAGIAIQRNRYDRLGRPVEETYFDEHERPAAGPNGDYGRRTAYDSRGRVVSTHFLDARGAVAPTARLGYAGVAYRYDGLGRVIEEQYLAADGHPVRGGAVARLEYRFDELGHPIERRYYAAGGGLMRSPLSGCAVFQTSYGSTGEVASERCLDPQERLTPHREGGWARHVVTREHARVVREEYFDTTGRLLRK